MVVGATAVLTARHVVAGALDGQRELQRDWVVSSAECSHLAKEAWARTAEVLTDHAPRERPDDELARAWAAVGQRWASLSHAEAVRSMAVAAFAVNQVGVNAFPIT